MKLRLAVLAAVLAAFFAVPAQAQVTSNVATVNLNFTQSESVTVSAAPTSLTFNSSGVATVPLVVTTSWNVNLTRNAINTYMYFSTVNAMTDTTGDNIPMSSFTSNCGVGTATFGDTTPWNFNGVPVFSQLLSTGLYSNLTGTPVSCQLSFTGASVLPAGVYSGVLNIEAQAA
jgi:hypothetical protein